MNKKCDAAASLSRKETARVIASIQAISARVSKDKPGRRNLLT